MPSNSRPRCADVFSISLHSYRLWVTVFFGTTYYATDLRNCGMSEPSWYILPFLHPARTQRRPFPLI